MTATVNGQAKPVGQQRQVPLASSVLRLPGQATPATAPTGRSAALRMIEHESRSLLVRLGHIKSFVLHEAMVPAAGLSPQALTAIEKYLLRGRRDLRERVEAFLQWLRGPEARTTAADELQKRFTFLRLKYNDVLSQFDMFSEVVTQRSEHDIGVWLSGIDVCAIDALQLAGKFYDIPPVVCYLARGPGAAIRRVKTRMPGETENPVAMIRIPRERMIGTGISSSLVHEAGHQGASLLGLIESIRPVLQERAKREAAKSKAQSAWTFWDRWISEILSDFWGVGKVGIASTFGLIAVVSLPSVFVFRIDPVDPHPASYIRVKLSCAIGKELYPHPQWDAIAKLWESLYPMKDLDPKLRETFRMLEAGIPEFIKLICEHRPQSLKGRSLRDVMPTGERTPEKLGHLYKIWKGSMTEMRSVSPTLAFAALGQARADGHLSPERESQTLSYLLKYWALKSTLDIAEQVGNGK